MKEIPLTQGKVALVDDEDFEWLNQWKWRTKTDRNTWYAVRSVGKRPNKTLPMHRLIMQTPDGMEVDHIDHNGLHNYRSNLRNCTRTQNVRNSKKRKDNTSGYRGVSKHVSGWQAHISINRKILHLGTFSTTKEAAVAYDKKASELFGEFAELNFPD